MSRKRPTRPIGGFQRRPRIADQMTPQLSAFFDRSMAAERAGDAAEALAYHSGIPMFRRGRHHAVLEQLVEAKGELTPWAWTRWIVYQALRCEDRGSRTAAGAHGALEDAMHTFHADSLGAAYVQGGDPIQVFAQVMGESWGFQQLAAYEYGALAAFLDEFAQGELAGRSELARSWVAAAMGGYRIEGRAGPCTLVVRDLATDDEIEVLDLGAGGMTGTGGSVIGRLVPSGSSPDLMFDLTPLTVDEGTAREVAGQGTTNGGWAEVLRHAIEQGTMHGTDLLREDYELMTDVHSLGLVEFGTRPVDLPRVMAQLRDGRDEVGRAAFRILRSAAEGSLANAAAPYVAAAVLNVHAYGEAQRHILSPGQQGCWTRWAELVPAPARGRLLHFASRTAEVA